MARRDSQTARDAHERRLFIRLCEGDLGAFESFCTRLEGPVYSYVLRLVRDPTEAEDISQEALLRLYRLCRDRRIRVTDGSPRALVFRIAHNLAMDYFRKTRRTPEMNLATPAAASRSTERTLLREQIDRALAEIPESHRNAIMLREFGDLSYGEIAELLDASLDQVKVWIYRARKRLAKLLDRDGQYVGEAVRKPRESIAEPLGDAPHAG